MASPTLANRTSLTFGYDGSTGTRTDLSFTAESSDCTKANHIPSGLHTARLFETERAARQQAEKLQAATQALSATLDLQQVLERILTELRHVVVCNGRRLALRSTGRKGEYVVGVRYRAWQPPSALHPTIKPRSPLVFNVIDTWSGQAIGGCTYHVSHPGGRSYDVFPVNAYEAETRRVSRFWNYGHTPGPLKPPPRYAPLAKFFTDGHEPRPMSPPPEDINPEYPGTLDLRYRNRCG